MANDYDPILKVIDEYDLPTDEVDEQLVTRARETYGERLKEIEQLKARAAKSEAAYLQLQDRFDGLEHERDRLRVELKEQASQLEKATAKAETYKRDWYQAKSEFGDAAAKLRGELRDAQGEVSRLVALLASGQCVDLSRLTDSELGGVSVHGGNCDDAGCDTRISFGEDLRQWLIEKAGVKL